MQNKLVDIIFTLTSSCLILGGHSGPVLYPICGKCLFKQILAFISCKESGFLYLYNLQHLHSSDLAVSVQVVHVEGPVELLLEASPWRDGQGADELSEVDSTVTILIKGPECMLRKLRRVTVREELQEKKIRFADILL